MAAGIPQGVGLGTFPLSGVFGSTTPQSAAEVVETFLGNGGKYIQTAPYYDGVEDLLGNLLQPYSRDSYFLTTLGVKLPDGSKSGRAQSIREQCVASMERLGVDYLDLYMSSSAKVDDATIEETAGALRSLKEDGLVRFVGVCNVDADQLLRYRSEMQVDVVQNRFSAINRVDQRSVLDLGGDEVFVPYNIIERGILTSRSVSGFSLRSGDLRERVSEFEASKLKILSNWIRSDVAPIAKRSNRSVEQLVIGWTLAQNRVQVALVGATKSSQVQEALASAEVGAVEMEELEGAVNRLAALVLSEHQQSLNEFLGNTYS